MLSFWDNLPFILLLVVIGILIVLFKVRLYEIEFLKQQGEKEWLQGLNYIPAKLRALCEINKILAHQPWLLKASHIEVGVKIGLESKKYI